MTTTERLLQSGLLEAIADLEFLHSSIEDGPVRLVAESALELANLYLRAAKEKA